MSDMRSKTTKMKHSAQAWAGVIFIDLPMFYPGAFVAISFAMAFAAIVIALL